MVPMGDRAKNDYSPTLIRYSSLCLRKLTSKTLIYVRKQAEKERGLSMSIHLPHQTLTSSFQLSLPQTTVKSKAQALLVGMKQPNTDLERPGNLEMHRISGVSIIRSENHTGKHLLNVHKVLDPG
jgi:hypothetical protein